MTDQDKKTFSEDDYLDAADFESEADDLSDSKNFDEDSDDGIFAPSPAKKKKNSKFAAIAVVAVALLSGAGFYYFSSDEQKPAPAPTAAVPASDTAAAPSEENVGESQQAALPSAIPSPASDFPVDAPKDEAVTVTTADAATVSQSQPSPDVVTVKALDEPAIPADETIQKVTNEKKEPDLQAEPSTEAVHDEVPLSEPPSITSEDVPSEVVAEQGDKSAPDGDDLAPVSSQEPKKNNDKNSKKSTKNNELEDARETINVSDEAPVAKTKYFDAPGGKALLDLPPPSINPMTEPGQSIIIVSKGKKTSGDVLVEKGDDSGFIESKLVSASRAAKLGRNQAALDFYNELYRKNQRDPRILMGRAVTYQKLGETQKAIAGYQDVLDVEPNNPEAITNLMGLIGQTKPAVALQNLLDLRERFPKNPSVAAQLGVAYAQSGNPQDAIKYLDIAANLQPENPLHYFNMGVISERMDDRQKAISYYEQALDVYSVNGSGTDSFSREQIYDRLAKLRGN